ncbi:MAG: dockerin type I repeat-containing protein [Planctomycetota bacterium]
MAPQRPLLRSRWRWFTRMACVFVFGVIARPIVGGQSVLVLDTGTLNQTTAQVVASLALSAQLTSTTAAFVDAVFFGGPWDLVIVEAPNQFLGDDVAFTIDSIVAGGGRVILSYFALDASSDGEILRNAFGVLDADDYFFPLELSRWDLAHPVWNTPNPISSTLVPLQDAWGDDGDQLTAATGALAIGGFTVSSSATNAGIVIGNSDRTIVNGFLFDSYPAAEGAALLTNEIAFLLAGITPGTPDFTRGDANADGAFNIADAVFVLGSLFVPGSPSPSCADAGDANDDGLFNIADAIYALSALFTMGAPPAAPYPGCGPEATADTLDCAAFAACP